MIITKKSMLSGKENTMDIPVTLEDLERWRMSGQLIQHVFPHLSADQREFLTTGVTPEEWNNAFGRGD